MNLSRELSTCVQSACVLKEKELKYRGQGWGWSSGNCDTGRVICTLETRKKMEESHLHGDLLHHHGNCYISGKIPL
jgi:hypothetical protein